MMYQPTYTLLRFIKVTIMIFFTTKCQLNQVSLVLGNKTLESESRPPSVIVWLHNFHKEKKSKTQKLFSMF